MFAEVALAQDLVHYTDFAYADIIQIGLAHGFGGIDCANAMLKTGKVQIDMWVLVLSHVVFDLYS